MFTITTHDMVTIIDRGRPGVYPQAFDTYETIKICGRGEMYMLDIILKLGALYIGGIILANIVLFSLMAWAIIYINKKAR